MEKYSLEQAENEALKIKEFAENNKAERDYQNESLHGIKNTEKEPAAEDYETANSIANYLAERENRAELTLKNLKEIDLSTAEGRIAVAEMYYISKYAPEFGPKDEEGKTIELLSLGNVIKDSVSYSSRGNRKTNMPSFDKENFLKKLENIQGFYGHRFCVRSSNLHSFLVGVGYNFNQDLDLIDETGKECQKLMFCDVLSASSSLSSETLNSCLSGIFLSRLSVKIQKGEIIETKAKTHPNYALIEELALKADKQQKSVSDIIFKMFSSYIQTNNFQEPSVTTDLKEINDIIKNYKEVRDISFNSYKISKTLDRDEVRSAVESFSYSEDLEKEVRGLMHYVDFFQSILDRYNSKMTYLKSETK